jgi:hypothetical protein
MAVFRLLQGQLTLIDLSLDPRISIQYDIAKAIYSTFSSDYAIAKRIRLSTGNYGRYETRV